jgi:16S rRNA (cytidine1402-2'-O)-methyltransferase
MSETFQSPGKLILFPTPISGASPISYLSPASIEVAKTISIFFVEKSKNARSIIGKLGLSQDMESLNLVEIGKNRSEEEIEEGLLKLVSGNDGLLMSDAGMPCIGDPGWEIVLKAHQFGIRVVPFPGPSSFLQALMASGFSGQNFSFHGYLPIDRDERRIKLKELNFDTKKTGRTQIFMETPYRNREILASIIKICEPDQGLSISVDLNGPKEEIISARIRDWQKMNYEIPKIPCVFVLGSF